MKKLILIAAMSMFSLTSFTQKIPQNQIIGFWKSEDYKIEIFKTGNTYAAKLLWSKDMFEADGITLKKDTQNPDPKLRNRSVQGITHITGLKYNTDDNQFTEGLLYSAKNGMTLNFKAELISLNVLETRVYKGITLMGKTVIWNRAK